MSPRPYQICNRCVMDTTASEIVFYDVGCNFCETAKKALEVVACDKTLLAPTVQYIKDKGKGQEYDILIGLSGGVDSSLALVKALELGLRPLCFTLETGWNTPTADENIMRLVEGLKVPLYRYVINLDKFKKLQAAYLESGLKNIEVPTDHVLMAASYELAAEHGIEIIVSGGNVATESIMPESWGYNARDLVQIKAVYKERTGEELIEKKPFYNLMSGKVSYPSDIPTCGLIKWNIYKWFYGIRTFYILDFFDYRREDAIEELAKLVGYKHPGEKHCESYYTWWFQNYYLFEKFNIDKRKAHWSSLIMSGQLSRELAVISLESSPVYPHLGIEKRALSYRPRDYKDYPNDEKLYKIIAGTIRFLKNGFVRP